jgi:hypothetical protein
VPIFAEASNACSKRALVSGSNISYTRRRTCVAVNGAVNRIANTEHDAEASGFELVHAAQLARAAYHRTTEQ